MSGSIERRVRELIVQAASRGYGLHLTPTPQGFDTQNGDRINITNITAECRRTEPDRWPAIVFEFVARIAGAPQPGSARTMSDHEFMDRARARILPSNYFTQAAGASARYCRKLVSDNPTDRNPLIALSLDYPDTIMTITDDDLTGRDIDSIWTAALAATGAEHDYTHHTLGTVGHEGIHVLQGDSLYVASQILNPHQLLNELGTTAPHGFVFAIPTSNTLAIHCLQSTAAVRAIREIVTFAVQMATDGPRLTHEVFYWHTLGIQQITLTDRTTSTMTVQTEGHFARALNTLPEHN